MDKRFDQLVFDVLRYGCRVHFATAAATHYSVGEFRNDIIRVLQKLSSEILWFFMNWP